MKIKFFFLTLLTLLCCSAALAQQGEIKGVVVNRASRATISDVKVTLSPGGRTTYTERGVFEFRGLLPGNYKILMESDDFQALEVSVLMAEGQVRDLGRISVASEYVVENLDANEFSEFDPEDGGGGEAMPVVLSASKDIFDNVAGYKFGQMRFRTRGYGQEMSGVYLNGVYFNDAMSGYTPWSLWSGLNDATRTQEYQGGLGMLDYGVGGINGVTNVNARASQMRKGYRFSLVNASAQYRFRVMATYASGEMDNGWSYGLSLSTRQGGNDWVNGIYYNSWGYFGSVEKKINPFHRLGLTFFGAPGERAAQGASTQETYDLVGSNFYNPNWGYQDGTSRGDMRSARVRRTHEPVTMLNYTYEPSTKFNIQAAVSYRFGQNGYSALDWYDAPDPRPDYYRNLPSYYRNENSIYDDPYKAEIVKMGWKSDWNIRQIDWQRLYEVNRNSMFEDDNTEYHNNMNPNGKRRSKYVLEERRADQQDFNAKLQTTFLLGEKSKMTLGYDFRYNRTEYFKVMKDLLGGDYWLDIDNFAERDFAFGNAAQNNMLTPNRLIEKGDKYGYDYYAHLYQDRVWAMYRFNNSKWDARLGVESGHTRFYREGRYQKGLFPDNSQGKSREQNFWTYTIKGGVTYNIAGNQMVYANAAKLETAPYFQNAFISPRTRNTVTPNLKTEKVTSVDINYALRLPTFKLRVTGFFTDIKDKSKVISYYDDLSRTFNNFAMTGIDQRHMGVELGVEAPIAYGIAVRGAFSYGYYHYSSNPYVTVTQDNNETELRNERVYWKDMKIEGTPQTAASLGLNYRGPGNIWAGIDVNYFDAMYLGMNPLRRTDQAHTKLNEAQSQSMAKQELLDDAFVVNANFSKSWYLKGGYNLGFSLEVKNILNNTNIRTGGFEQMRLKKITREGTSQLERYDAFDSKYYYLFGTNYYLNIYLRF